MFVLSPKFYLVKCLCYFLLSLRNILMSSASCSFCLYFSFGVVYKEKASKYVFKLSSVISKWPSRIKLFANFFPFSVRFRKYPGCGVARWTAHLGSSKYRSKRFSSVLQNCLNVGSSRNAFFSFSLFIGIIIQVNSWMGSVYNISPTLNFII